ncbi:hypothetical protein CPB86DRAFT_869654 [Serendipita vermifera]|nr:hypothetical protein CPB86DRAFT_869654 [Serendipita vermifera]
MGSLDDNALKNELAEMQQRLLSALQHGDEQVHSFLRDWDHLKQQLIHGLSTGRVSEETKQLAADVARHVALIAQSFLKLEQVSGVLTKDSTTLSTVQKDIKKHDSLPMQPRQADSAKAENDDRLQRYPSKIEPQSDNKDAGTALIESKLHTTVQQEHESDQSDLDVDSSSDSDTEELLSNADSTEDTEDPNWDVLRDWMLSNIAVPFLPTGPEARELECKAGVDSDGLICWIESTRNQCGWSDLLAKYAHGDLNKMRDLCLDIFCETGEAAATQSYPQELVNDFLAMREYLRSLDTTAPSSWWTEIGQLLSEVFLDDEEDDAESIWASESMIDDETSEYFTLGASDIGQTVCNEDASDTLEGMDSQSEIQPSYTATGRKRKAEDDLVAPRFIQQEQIISAVHLPHPKRRRIAPSESGLVEDLYSASSTPSSNTGSYSSHHSSPAPSLLYTSSIEPISDLSPLPSSNTHLETSAPSDSPLLLDSNNTLTALQSSITSKTHYISMPLDFRSRSHNTSSPRSKLSSANHWVDPYYRQDLDNSTIRSDLTYCGRKRKREHSSQNHGYKRIAMQSDASATLSHGTTGTITKGRPLGNSGTTFINEATLGPPDQPGPRKRAKLDQHDAMAQDLTAHSRSRSHAKTPRPVSSSSPTPRPRPGKRHTRSIMSLRTSQDSALSPPASRLLATSRYGQSLESDTGSFDVGEQVNRSLLEETLCSILSDPAVSSSPNAIYSSNSPHNSGPSNKYTLQAEIYPNYQISDCSTPGFDLYSASDSPVSSIEANTPAPEEHYLDKSSPKYEQVQSLKIPGIFTG